MLGVVGDHYRAADVFFGQPALVLGLQVKTPFDREVEFLAGGLQQLDRVAVFDALERCFDEFFQARDGVFLHALGDEGHVIGALVEHGAEHVLEEFFGHACVFGQIGEGDFRLDHPELGQMARGMAVLGAEGGAEGVDLAHRQAERLDVELAGHRQEHFLAEEVAGKVDLALVGARQVGHVQRGNAEHLAGAFGVGGGDDRRVDPVEAVFVEVTMRRLCQAVADTGDGAEQVGARAQMRHLAQEFE